ncbi:MAG: hypothetical protein ACON5N_14235 [Akkermansiaceae bacterium]
MKTAIHSVFLIIFLNATLLGKEWPSKITPSNPVITPVEKGDGRFHYSSPAYHIDSSVEIDGALLANLARTAESVSVVLKQIPLPLHAPGQGGKPAITITSDDNEYRRFGGARGTAGYYNGRRHRIILQWEHFRPNKEHSRLIPLANYDLLVHELTHLGMHRHMGLTPAWLTEGTAEYLVAAHTTKGAFDFTSLDRSIRKRLESNSPPESKVISVLNLAQVLKMTDRDWQQMTSTQSPYQTLRAYKSSLLLTHYYFHGGKEHRTEIKEFLAGFLALKRRDDPLPVLSLSHSPLEIQKRLSAYWTTKGIRLDWQ